MPLTPDKIEVFPAIRPDEAAGFRTIGARGCLLSHLAILKRARESGWSRVLVLEDDLAMSRKIATCQAQIVEFLEKNPWDFVFFGHVLKLKPGDPNSVGFERYSDTIMTSHFYSIQERVFDGLIQFMEELQTRPGGHADGVPMFPDGAISWFRTHSPDVVTWVANPNLGWQRSSRSDIYPNRWFDRVPLVKELVAGARRVKMKLQPRD